MKVKTAKLSLYLILLTVTACANEAHTVKIPFLNSPTRNVLTDESANGEEIFINELDKSTNTYKITVKTASEETSYFATLLEHCSKRFGYNSVTNSGARKLLIGFEDPKIKSKELVTINSKKVLFTDMAAKIDSKPLTLHHYHWNSFSSSDEESCNKDLVIWSQKSLLSSVTKRIAGRVVE